MFRNSLNQQQPPLGVAVSNGGDLEEAGDEYYEFDGARLEIKHNATIRQSEVSIAPKITAAMSGSGSGVNQSSILEGSDSINSPVDEHNPITAMADNNISEGEQMCGCPF